MTKEYLDSLRTLVITLLVASAACFAVWTGLDRLYAQDGNERTRAALPALVEQRNNAMDAAALCQGDVAILKQQLAEAKAEIEKLKAPK